MATPTAVGFGDFFTATDTFTTVGTGAVQDTHTSPIGNFALQVKGTGAAATLWTVILEGSFDNVNWTTLLTHNTATGDGNIVGIGSNAIPVLYVRTHCTVLTLGGASNIVVTTLGKL